MQVSRYISGPWWKEHCCIRWSSASPFCLSFLLDLVSFRFPALASSAVFSWDGRNFCMSSTKCPSTEKKDRKTHPQHPVAHDDLWGCIRQNDAKWRKLMQKASWTTGNRFHLCLRTWLPWSKGNLLVRNRTNFSWQPLPLWPCHHSTSSKALQNKSIHIAYLVVSTHLKNIEKCLVKLDHVTR